jgi:hypothetical protein
MVRTWNCFTSPGERLGMLQRSTLSAGLIPPVALLGTYVVLVGMRTPEQVRRNAAIADDMADRVDIRAVHNKNVTGG